MAEQLVPRLLAAAGPLWEALLAPGGSLAALEPLGAVVLAEVVDAISDIMPGGALVVPCCQSRVQGLDHRVYVSDLVAPCSQTCACWSASFGWVLACDTSLRSKCM